MLFFPVCRRVNNFSFAILILGIVVIFSGFTLSNCGSGPTIKTNVVNTGAWAVQFDGNYLDPHFIGTQRLSFEIKNTPLTAEAWIKGSEGCIIRAGSDKNGYFLYVENNKAIFLIRSFPISSYPPPGLVIGDCNFTYFCSSCTGCAGSSCDDCGRCGKSVCSDSSCSHSFWGTYNTCSTCTGCSLNDTWKCSACASCDSRAPGANATISCSVTGSTSINSDTWHHIAGVLGSHSHTAPDPQSCIDVSEALHLDIYVDGSVEACAAAVMFIDDTPSNSSETFGWDTTMIVDWLGYAFLGIIDEVRLWNEARTASLIQAAMNTEITWKNWGQLNPNGALMGYWTFNEGFGSTVYDISGNSNDGALEHCTEDCES